MVRPIDISIWGTDLRLYNNDIKVSSGGDLELVQSLDNLAQAVRLRLISERGALPSNPDYGVDTNYYVGRKNTVEKQEMLKLAIVEELSKDGRIASIDAVTVTQDPDKPDTLYVSISITPINSEQTLTLNLIYPWYQTGTIEQVIDEASTSITKRIVDVDYDIHSVVGVYTTAGSHTSISSTGATTSGTNYYTPSGSFSGKRMTLSRDLPQTFTSVYCIYNKYTTEQRG